jgi:hypothetical protein
LHHLLIRLGTLFLVGSWTLGVSPAATPPRNPPNHSDHSILRGSIPVKVYRGFLVVAEGQFGGNLKPQNFVIDTGTSPSVLNIRVASELGLSLHQAQISAVGRQSEISAALVPEILLGPLRVKSIHFLVTDLSAAERELGVPIAGILGMDVLGKNSFRLDYRNHLLEFGDVIPEGIPVVLSTSMDLPIVEVIVEGRVLHLLVDTGSERLVFFANMGVREFSLDASNELVPGRSIAGTVPGRTVSSLVLEVDGKRFRQEAVLVPSGDASLFDGLLSVRSLGIRVLSLDANRRVVYLLK